MTFYRLIVACLIVGSFHLSCLVPENPYTAIPPGIWRGVLQLDPVAFVPPDERDESIIAQEDYVKELPEGSLPFLFEVIYDDEETFHIEIINGKERLLVDDIGYGRNIRTAIDTLYIDFPVYDSHLEVEFRESVLDGYWVVRSKKDYRIPFTAQHGIPDRFEDPRETPVTDLTGRWEATFSLEEAPYPAIGEFQQQGNRLEGTFLTETGDYRFLSGTIQGDEFALSTFDGSHAFLFEGKVLEDGSLIGSFRSGKHYETTWEAVRNEAASLMDPDSLTYLIPDAGPFTFSFPAPNGEVVSLTDPAFEGKVKIVQILGTWCPNCRDETEFLAQYLSENPDQEVAIIGLAFEKYAESDRALEAIRTYRQQLGVPYPILYAGSSEKVEAAKALPMLNHILSYPTMLFLDRNNEVRRIHTGFAGPATSAYPDFVAEFTTFMNDLLEE